MEPDKIIRIFICSKGDTDPEIGRVRVALKAKAPEFRRKNLDLVWQDQTTGGQFQSAIDSSLEQVKECQILIVLCGSAPGDVSRKEWRLADSLDRLTLEYHLAGRPHEEIEAIERDVFPEGRRSIHLDDVPVYENRIIDPNISASEIALEILNQVSTQIDRVRRRSPEDLLRVPTDHLVREIHDYAFHLGQSPTRIDEPRRNCFDFIAFTRNEDGWTQSCLMFCTEDVVDLEALEQVAERARQKKAETFCLITSQQFETYHVNRAQELGGRLESIYAYLRRYLDIENDFKDVRDEVHALDVTRRYVELDYAKRNVASSGHDEEPASRIDTRILNWMRGADSRQMAVLGEFGSGKSWLCLSVCNSMIEEIENRQPGARLPLLIKLNEFAQVDPSAEMDLIKHINDMLRERHRTDDLSFVKSVLKHGRLLIVLDGFDELGIGLSSEARTFYLKSIQKLAIGKNKILLTSRTSFFDSTQAERDELNRVTGDGDDTVARLDFYILHLADMTDQQVRRRLQGEFGPQADTYWDRIQKTPNLASLVHRPIVLDMVLQILIASNEDQDLTLFGIYEECAKLWLTRVRRDADEWGDKPLESDQRANVMIDLAWVLYGRRDEAIELHGHIDDIPEFSAARMADLLYEIEETFDLDAVSVTRAQTFLVRDGQGKYSFAHRSFMEFFVALKLKRDLEQGRLETLDSKNITDGVARFLSDTDLDMGRMLEGLEYARRQGADGFERLEQADRGWLAGNLLTLICKVNPDMRHIDLRCLFIKHADLSRADLREVDFSGSTLDHVRLNGADISRADWRKTKLSDLMLGVKASAKCVACSPTEPIAAITNSRNEILLVNLEEDIPPVLVGEHANSITYLRFSEDGKLLASIGFDKKLKVWSVSQRTLRHSIELKAETDYGLALIEAGDTYALVGGNDNVLRIFSLQREVQVRRLEDNDKALYCIATDASSQHFATASFDGTVNIYRYGRAIASLNLSPRYPGRRLHDSLVNGVAFRAGGDLLASADNSGKIYVWPKTDTGYAMRAATTKLAHDSQIWSIQFSPDGKYAVTASTDTYVKVWSVEEDWSLVATLQGHTRTVWNAAFDSTGRYVVSCSQDATVRIWDWQSEDLSKPEPRCIQVGTSEDQGLKFDGLRIEGAEGLSNLQIDILGGGTDA